MARENAAVTPAPVRGMQHAPAVGVVEETVGGPGGDAAVVNVQL
jgi:hypothetical protein